MLVFESTNTIPAFIPFLQMADTLAVSIVIVPRPIESRPRSISVESLLVRFQVEQTDQAAVELQRLVSRLLAMDFRHQLGPEDLEDLCQEVMLRLVRGFRNGSNLFKPGERGEGSAVTWLRTVCRNLAFDLLKRSNRIRMESLLEERNGEMGGHVPAVEPEFDAWVEKLSVVNRVRALFGLLSDRDQVNLNMYLEGYPDKEIANRLGEAYGSIPTLRSRAVAKLQKLMREKDPSL